jgi:hypothetical protein
MVDGWRKHAGMYWGKPSMCVGEPRHFGRCPTDSYAISCQTDHCPDLAIGPVPLQDRKRRVSPRSMYTLAA